MASKGMRSTLQATKERLPSLAKGGGAVSVRAREHSDDGLPGNNPGLSKSAAITKLKRELAVLKDDNISLSKELLNIKALHQQLIHEAPEEKFSEKRVNLLKSQIFQLERQVVMMSQSLGTRGELLADLHSTMAALEEQTSGEMLQTVSSLKLRLAKYTQQSGDIAQPVQFLDSFIKSKSRTAMRGVPDAMQEVSLTLVDICRGGALSHVSRKHVSELEVKLSDLFGQLVQLKTSLQAAPDCSRPLLQPIREHCADHVTKCCKLIGECSHDLLCLSMLLPSPPQPQLRGSEISPTLTANDVIKTLPSSVRSRQEVGQSIEAAVRAFNHRTALQDEKLKALELELQFHRDVYNLQVEYIDQLFHATRLSYQEFEQSLQDMICSPLAVILNKYDALTETVDEESLRDFLSCFKQHHTTIKDTLERIKKAAPSCSNPSTGAESLSQFGQEFFEQLHKLEERQSNSVTHTKTLSPL